MTTLERKKKFILTLKPLSKEGSDGIKLLLPFDRALKQSSHALRLQLCKRRVSGTFRGSRLVVAECVIL